MVRLARRLVPPIAALVCIAAAVLWRRSYGGDVDLLIGVGPTARFNAAASYQGKLVFFFSDVPSEPGTQWSLQPLRAPVEEVQPLYEALFEQGTTLRASIIGFQLGHGRINVFMTPPTFTAVTVPHWFLVVATAVPTLLWLRGTLRHWRWARQGRCRSCGYDLRSSPDRCPECGAVPKKSAAAKLAAMAAAILLAALAPAGAPAEDGPTDKRIDELNLSHATLEGAFDVLRDKTHANIVVRWPALAAAGLDRTTPVKLHLWNVRLATALDILLEATEPLVKLDWSEEDGVITVSIKEDLEHTYPPVVYDVRDLIELMLKETTPGPPDEFGRTRQEVIDELTRLITEAVAPDTWRDAGGSVGSMREFGGRLIVTQSPENHQMLKKLLDELREEFGRPMPTIKPVPATVPAGGKPLLGKTCLYDVRDLLAASAAIDAEWNSDPRTPYDLEDQLIDAIIDNVEPYSWQGRPNRSAVGSTGNGINVIGGRIVVRQSPEGHEMLKRFLAELRKELLPGVKVPATSPSAPIRRARPRAEGLFGSSRG
jgi:hypothetical protein